MRSFWLFCLVLALGGCTGGKPAYNVVLVSIDTQRADHLGAMGFSRFPISPNFDRIAAKSVLFTSAFANASVTTASHMSMFTGLFPDQHRVNNIVKQPGRSETLPEVLDPGVRTLPELLREKGYRTARFVFSRDFYLDAALGFGRGFDMDFPYGLDSTVATNRIAKWLAQEKDGPFFAFVHSKRPHAPYLFPESHVRQAESDGRLAPYSGPVISSVEKWAEKFGGREWFGNALPGIAPDCWYFGGLVRQNNPADRRRVEELYALGVQLADQYLGQLLSALEDSGKLENTIVVITSDHGEQLLQRGELSHMTLYREELHVPLLIHLPAGLRGAGPGRRIGADVQTVDIVPTVLALLGLPVPSGLAGRDLGPLIRGEAAAAHDELYAVNKYAAIAQTAALRTPEWSLVKGDDGDFRLFNRKDDPLETRDLASSRPEQVKALSLRLKQQELRGYSFGAAP